MKIWIDIVIAGTVIFGSMIWLILKIYYYRDLYESEKRQCELYKRSESLYEKQLRRCEDSLAAANNAAAADTEVIRLLRKRINLLAFCLEKERKLNKQKEKAPDGCNQS